MFMYIAVCVCHYYRLWIWRPEKLHGRYVQRSVSMAQMLPHMSRLHRSDLDTKYHYNCRYYHYSHNIGKTHSGQHHGLDCNGNPPNGCDVRTLEFIQHGRWSDITSSNEFGCPWNYGCGLLISWLRQWDIADPIYWGYNGWVSYNRKYEQQNNICHKTDYRWSLKPWDFRTWDERWGKMVLHHLHLRSVALNTYIVNGSHYVTNIISVSVQVATKGFMSIVSIWLNILNTT